MILTGTRYAHTARSPMSLLSFRSFSVSPVTRGKQLSWDKFFKLRMYRRRVGTVCSVATTVLATGGALAYFGNLEIDMNERFFGVDSMWIYGGAIVASGFLGYLMGPTVGNAMFRLRLGKYASQFMEKDALFLRHIRENRPDPAKQSYINPLNDYYGEKIYSIDSYRRWLRDSRLYTRKSKTFL